MEFCRDVAMQSELFSTTQENVIYYLKHSRIPPSWIVFNSGAHEVALIDRISGIEKKFEASNGTEFLAFCRLWGDIYEKNLNWILNLLLSMNGVRVLFITTSLVQGNRKGPKNILIRHLNERAALVIETLKQHILDVTPLLDNEECRPLYTDSIHLQQVYYKAVVEMILQRLHAIAGRSSHN
jgi:hypothetical protein